MNKLLKTVNKRKKLTILILAGLIIVLGVGMGIFTLVVSYRMSLIPTMTFEEMLNYTTENNEKAIISVGIIKEGEMNITVYGNNAVVLPNIEYEYEIGSITKTFTTALLSKAINEGKIKLTDSIDKHMELPPKDYYPSYERLVTHTSGYKSHYFDWQMASNFFQGQENDFYGITNENLNTKAGKISLENKNHPFKYSNFGIAVVGSALSALYESDYTTVMTDFIVSELKLPNTKIADATGNLDNYWNWNPTDGYISAGAIISTINDMIQYLNLHMTETLPYLPLSHKKIAKINATTEQNAEMEIRMDSMGIGWMIDTKNNIIWHNGGTSNFNSYIAFDKERQIGVVILANLPPNYRLPTTPMGAKLMTTLQQDHSKGVPPF